MPLGIQNSNETGLGFIIILNWDLILIVGPLGAMHFSPMNAKIDAVILALQICKDRDWSPNKIFCDYPRLLKSSKTLIWGYNSMIQRL